MASASSLVQAPTGTRVYRYNGGKEGFIEYCTKGNHDVKGVGGEDAAGGGEKESVSALWGYWEYLSFGAGGVCIYRWMT